MTYNISRAPSNCDVHSLNLTKAELLLALSAASGQTIPANAHLVLDDDGDIGLEWQTPKA